MRYIIVILLAVGVLALACGDTDGDNGAPDTVEPTATVDADAALREEAENFCPLLVDDFFEGCVDSYIGVAKSGRAAILCVDDGEGTWYFTTPGATPVPDLVIPQIGNEASFPGDDCREPGHGAMKLLGD